MASRHRGVAMETEKRRDAAAVRVFPPGVPLVTVLVGVGLDYLWSVDPGFALPAPERYWLGGLIVAGSFLGLGFWSVRIFRRSGQSENPWKPTPQIVERGPFRVTRNPMYPQMLLICVGIGRHPLECLGSAPDAALRLGPAKIRDRTGGSLSRGQVRRCLPCL